MLRTVVLLGCVIAASTAQKAKPPKITSLFPKRIYFRDVTDPQTLDCTAVGIPYVEYEWHFNEQKIDNDPGLVEITGGTLQLLKPNVNHEGFYQCFASNAYGKSMSTVVEIKKAAMLGYPTLPTFNAGSFDEGSHVTLSCRDQPLSVPTASYAWYVGKSEEVVVGQRIVIDQDGDLHFINIQPGDERDALTTYNCSLYNDLAQLRVYGSPTKFKVTPAPNGVAPRNPTIPWFTSVEQSKVFLGQAVTLQCIPDGHPLPTIEWSRVDGLLPAGRHTIDDEKYTLKIFNVTENDEGMYACTAVQDSLRFEQTIFLDVTSEPIWVNKPKSVTVTNGKPAKFQCVARPAIGDKENILVEWYKNGEPISGTVGKVTVSGTELTVSDVIKPDQLMNIQCKVSNSLGSQLGDAFLNVIQETQWTVRPQTNVVLIPGEEVYLRIGAEADPLYANRLTYRWSKDGQPVGTNHQQPVYVNAANTLVINATGFELDTDYLDLLGNYSCLVSIGLEGGEGDMVVSSIVKAKKKEEEPPVQEAGLWWIAIIVVVIVIIVIIIIICCLVYPNRGESYPVDEKERQAGHDPEKELADRGFQELSRAEGLDEKKGYGYPEQMSLTGDQYGQSELGSGDEYAGPAAEDGSFLGTYDRRKV